MLQADTLKLLRCPDDRSELTPASDRLVKQLNAAIRGGRVVNRAGKRLNSVLDAGLVRADGKWLYPIIDGIPVLLRDEAIELQRHEF